MHDVVCMGEMLIDFAPIPSLDGNPCFEQNPGGAPANVACALAKTGRKTAFIGKVGKDQFGRFCGGTLRAAGVDTTGLVVTEEHATTLAFVHLNEQGDRDFSFYRRGMADVSIRYDEVTQALLQDTRVFHFGSVSMTEEPARETTLRCVATAKENGARISYDPNLRMNLWRCPDEVRQVVLGAMPYADYLKVSEEEAVFLTGEESPAKAAALLSERYGISLVVVSQGPKGCTASLGGTVYTSQAYDVKTVDTTGSGDCFWGAILHLLLENGLAPERMPAEEVGYMLAYANAAGSLATIRKGAIPAISTHEEIVRCMQSCPLLSN